MGYSLYVTVLFFLRVVRDLAGTLRMRWRRFYRRTVLGEDVASIGVDVYPFFHHMTGVGWYEWNLLRALDKRDDGLFFNLYGHTFLAFDEKWPGEMPGETRMRYRIHHLAKIALLPHRGTVRFMRAFVEPLLRVLDGNDVLFAPNFFAFENQAAFGQTMVATVHDLAFITRPETVAIETLEQLRLHLPLTLYRAERLIAVSDATAEDLAEHLHVPGRRIHTIHEGLDPLFTQNVELDESPDLPEHYLLFVSTLEPRKNVVGILRAFRLLVDWGYEGQLLLVGRWGWRTEEIRAEIETSPVGERIQHLEDTTRKQLPMIYRNADVLLFPSWQEGFGLPLLEAMACGTPVVTSGQSSMPEIAGPAAAYADPARPHGIATAVSAIIEDPMHRERLVKLGKERATRFSWDKAAAATAQVLRQAAGLEPTEEDEYRA